MKRLIPTAVITVTIAFLCVFGYKMTERICNTVLSDLEECRSTYKSGDIEAAIKLAEKFEDKWLNEQKPRLATFANHGFLDEITVTNARLTAFCRMDEAPEFYAECYAIEATVKQILEESRLHSESFY